MKHTETISFADHVKVLDGWRGVSIVLVLITHLVPVGPRANTAIGILGMVLFFNLSGFLITSSLLREGASLRVFLIRRAFRIIPLAWLYFAVVFLFQKESVDGWIAHFLFYANLPPPQIRLATDHIWSVCVEMQFYAGTAILFAVLRKKGLMLLPILGMFFTGLRVHEGIAASSVTWFRVDEILSGCFLALVYHGGLGGTGARIMQLMRRLPYPVILGLLAISSLYGIESATSMNYLRPYFGALMIGTTLVKPHGALARELDRRWLYYLATISYALYVIHMGLTYTWLGDGALVEKYAKRPLLLAVLFALAHLSTFHFEQPMILLGKRMARRFGRANTATSVA